MNRTRLKWAVIITARALFYVAIILLCVLLAPEEPPQFIYTEF